MILRQNNGRFGIAVTKFIRGLEEAIMAEAVSQSH
jgi:hypothetical protein